MNIHFNLDDMKNFAAVPDFAFRSFQSEKEHEFRDKFSRDRDRILYSTEFRRLDRKTQVFISSYDDNNRNRLTHTIEVVQIAKTLAKYFGLNQELTEAIGYGHDVGHTPFGHTGERTLNLILNGCDKLSEFYNNKKQIKGFKHNWQSLRVTTKLEKISDCYDGLNLTDFTLWGLLHHTNRYYNCEDDVNIEFAGEYLKINKCDFYFEIKNKCNRSHKDKECQNEGKNYLDFYSSLRKNFNNSSWTLEALIVRMADEIAQRHHDIEDGINAKIIDNHELVDVYYNSFEKILMPTEKAKLTNLCREPNNNLFVKDLTNFIISFYVKKLIENTQDNLSKMKKKFNIKDQMIFHESKSSIYDTVKLCGLLNIVSFEKTFKEADSSVKRYLKHRILNSHLAQTMDGKSSLIIKKINDAFLTNPAQLPDKTITTFFKNYLTVEQFKKAISNKTAPSIAGYFRGELRSLQKESSDKEYVITLHRTIGDFIAGMTDSFALRQYEKLYGSSELKNY